MLQKLKIALLPLNFQQMKFRKVKKKRKLILYTKELEKFLTTFVLNLVIFLLCLVLLSTWKVINFM